jgi:acetyl-CoA synthetase
MSLGAGDASVLKRVRAFASTGEAWDELTWRWLFEAVSEKQRPIINYSGGTESGGGILVSYPFLPGEPASFNGPLPGMDVTVLDEADRPVVGQVGEPAVRNRWPGMTHAFWHDRERYLETYWSRWDGVWPHGDLASADLGGTRRIHGQGVTTDPDPDPRVGR